MTRYLFLLLVFAAFVGSAARPKVRPLTRHQAYSIKHRDTYDADIASPKSVTFLPDGSKYYVNSLEGCKTVVYDGRTHKKLAVIPHKFTSGEGSLWNSPSGYYKFTHYADGASKPFRGKPVESVILKDGKYLAVTYYRRTFDINAQDPSAIAIIDTKSDKIVRMIETGPLPKMLAVSHDGNTLAITHWGDNTEGFLDISADDPAQWRHLPPVTVGQKLKLNYSLTQSVNRDSNSGFAMRGTVFLPGDRYLLIGCLSGPIQIIDLKEMKHIGSITQVYNGRHTVLTPEYLYVSTTVGGLVWRVPVANLIEAIENREGRDINVKGWEKCHPGDNIRTIALSPSGKYIFCASNASCNLTVVRADGMEVIEQIENDPYPVGLAISPDGGTVIVTSQGKTKGPLGRGGNSVSVYTVEYPEPEPAPVVPKQEAPSIDTLPAAKEPVPATPPMGNVSVKNYHQPLIMGGVLVAILGAILLFRRKK